jgi:hypothetical protein
MLDDDPSEDNTVYTYHTDPENFVEVVVVPIHYHGTIDRIVVDKYGRWWLLDYKTAKGGADTNKLDTDDQISAYMWAAEQWFQHPIQGFIYLQLTKDVARPPKRLKDGSFSVEKKQKTTYALAKQAMIDEYGTINKVPNKYIDFLNCLAEKESAEGDRFIRWDFVKRSRAQIITTYKHIMGEVEDMIDSNKYLYPNPTRDCIWDCPLRDVCLAVDDDREEEAKFILETSYEQRPRGEEGKEPEWKEKLVYPTEPQTLATDADFAMELDLVFGLVLPDELKDDID